MIRLLHSSQSLRLNTGTSRPESGYNSTIKLSAQGLRPPLSGNLFSFIYPTFWYLFFHFYDKVRSGKFFFHFLTSQSCPVCCCGPARTGGSPRSRSGWRPDWAPPPPGAAPGRSAGRWGWASCSYSPDTRNSPRHSPGLTWITRSIMVSS